MKLLAYKINGKVVNRDIFNWSDSDLNGNKPWIVSDVVYMDYEDITSVQNWEKYAFRIDKDFLYVRKRINELIDNPFIDKNGDQKNTNQNLNYEDGLIASKYFLVDKSIRDEFLSESEQIFYWDILVHKSQECRKIRWEKAKSYISYNLSSLDSSDLAKDTWELCNNYINYNIISKSKDGISGLFDYLRGIEDYTLNGFPSKSYWSQQYQDKLLDILENGNY